MACRLDSAKPLSEPMLLIEPLGTNVSDILIGIQAFSFKKMHLKCHLQNGIHFVSALMCYIKGNFCTCHVQNYCWNNYYAREMKMLFHWIGRIRCFISVRHWGIYSHSEEQIDGLVQDCSNSSALAMELLQSCTKSFRQCWTCIDT